MGMLVPALLYHNYGAYARVSSTDVIKINEKSVRVNCVSGGQRDRPLWNWFTFTRELLGGGIGAQRVAEIFFDLGVGQVFVLGDIADELGRA